MFDWKAAPRPLVALSPMADMTDSAFCRTVKRFATPVMFREMVSADGIVHGNEKTFDMSAFADEERPIIQQIFGADPEKMAEATRLIDDAHRPDGFDINMGCPTYKITSNFNGASLMREPELAAKIVRAMKAATGRPVSVKMRLGWSAVKEVIDFAPRMEDAGADLISIHGRTKEQGYSGTADWETIGKAKERVSIPVLCNGDIFDADAAIRAMHVSGCDGVLIARGALGAPWVFREVTAVLRGETPPSLTNEERVATIRDHAFMHADAHDGSLVTFRKHLVWYSKGLRGAKSFREQAVRVTSCEDLEPVLTAYIKEHGSS